MNETAQNADKEWGNCFLDVTDTNKIIVLTSLLYIPNFQIYVKFNPFVPNASFLYPIKA